MTGGTPVRDGLSRFVCDKLLWVTDAVAAILLAADLAVVIFSVTLRSLFNAPVEWADDVARGLMVGSTFFGAASALGRSESVGVTFFVDLAAQSVRKLSDATISILVVVISAYAAFNAAYLGYLTTGQTTGAGLPLELTFYPMGAGAACMTVFAFCAMVRHDLHDLAAGAAVIAGAAIIWLLWSAVSPDSVPGSGVLMLGGFVLAICAGMSIGFALALATFIFIQVEGTLPGTIFAQQMARGIDNFVLLAVPFFILVGSLMEANGMSVRLIALLERLIGRRRGGLNVVMILSMMIFSGISGSKMADVAAVGSVLIPAARRSRQNPGSAVALLAASAVMAEAIPPCINLIILGFVANISIGGLFAAGLLPAVLMALALVVTVIAFGTPAKMAPTEAAGVPVAKLWSGAVATIGLLFLIFGGFKSGFATATEISAFAGLYALVVGGVAFRELRPGMAIRCFVAAATRSGLLLFIVAAAQSLAFVLTLEQIPHLLGEMLVAVSQSHGPWLFMLLSIAILIVMGSVLEGAAALIIFGPLLVPVATTLGIATLHYGIVLVIAMGIGLFAPPLGLGLYGACLIGNVPIEQTVKPILGYLGLLLLCLIAIAFVPATSLWLPTALGY